MKKLQPLASFTVLALLLVTIASSLRAASDEKLVITTYKDALGFLKPVPVNVSGLRRDRPRDTLDWNPAPLAPKNWQQKLPGQNEKPPTDTHLSGRSLPLPVRR